MVIPLSVESIERLVSGQHREKTTCSSLSIYSFVIFFSVFSHDYRTNIIFTDHFIELHHQTGWVEDMSAQHLHNHALHQPHTQPPNSHKKGEKG